jgi:hypothetical protein
MTNANWVLGFLGDDSGLCEIEGILLSDIKEGQNSTLNDVSGVAGCLLFMPFQYNLKLKALLCTMFP